MIGVFGAGFINFYDARSGEFVNIDNYSVAPRAATADMYRTISDDWPDYMETADRENLVGYKAVGVPGALMGWCRAEELYGRLGLDTVIQPGDSLRAARLPGEPIPCGHHPPEPRRPCDLPRQRGGVSARRRGS